MNYVSRVAQVDKDACVGCKTCERHCPTGAMKVREEGKPGFVSPCIKACPAGIDVPGYIALAGAGDYENAYRLIRRENPFPSVCGRICTHECQSACNRKEFDDPVAIRDIKRFVADKSYQEKKFVQETPEPKNGKRVAVIGAGPSGLSCAYYMALSGYDVDVFESEKVAGGVLYFGIPEYRLPKAILARDIQVIQDAGVKIHLNTKVGKDVQFDELRKKYHAIYVATGTQFSKHANILGEDMPGVYHGLDFLRAVALGEKPVIGKRVVVIGGGDTAIDASRTAVRMGAESVTILYRRRRTDMPAEEAELLGAFEEGVRVHELAVPVEMMGKGKVEKIKCIKTAVADYDEKGRRNTIPVGGSEFEVEADTVIVAVSQYSDLPFIDKEEVLTESGQFVVNEKGMTTLPGVFAGGDVVQGSVTAIEAIADGKKAAMHINNHLGVMGIIHKGEDIQIPAKEAPFNNAGETKMNTLPIDTRTKNNDEVALGLTEEQLKVECSRCMMCDGTVSVDKSLCIDCSLCWELCSQEAVHFKTLPERKVMMPKLAEPEQVDKVIEICTKAYLRPLDQICQCTALPAEVAVVAILNGARTLQDLYRATGIGGGCGGGLCGANVFRLFEAAGYPVEEPGDDGHYKITHSFASLPEDTGDYDPILDFRTQHKLQWNEEFVNNGIESYKKAIKERSGK